MGERDERFVDPAEDVAERAGRDQVVGQPGGAVAEVFGEAGQLGATDPVREAEEVLDHRSVGGLAAGNITVDDDGRESVRGGIDRGRQPRRPGADDRDVVAALARRLAPLMTAGGSLVTMSYLGAGMVVPHYNVMGVAKAALEASVRYLAADLGPKNIRVNAISAGPIRTLAPSAVGDFGTILELHTARAPLRRNVTLDDVGNAAAFLCSDLANGITGEILYVDGGFNTVGMSFPQEAGEG